MKGPSEFHGLRAPLFANQVFKYLRYEPGPTALRGVERKGLLACTARSGSSYLSVALDRFGFSFNEWLNTEGHVRRTAERDTVNTTKDLADALATDALAGGLVGLKVPLAGLAYLVAFNEFPERVGDWRIVFLRRDNVVRQAISRHIAVITKQWTAAMPAAREVRGDDYDFEVLRRYHDAVVNENAQWERIFAMLPLHPMRVVYEDIIADEDASLLRIASYFGFEGERPLQDAPARTIERQGTDLNREWEERFHDDLRAAYGDARTYLEGIAAG